MSPQDTNSTGLNLTQNANVERIENLENRKKELKIKNNNLIMKLRNKDEIIKQRDETIRIKDKVIKEKEEIIKEKQEVIKEKANAVREKEDAIREKEDAIREKEDAIREKEDAIREKEDAIREKEDAIREKEEAIRENEEAIREKEDVIREKEDAIRGKDEVIRKKEEALKERDDAYNVLKDLMERREKVIKEKEKELRILEQAVLKLKVELESKVTKCLNCNDSQNKPNIPSGTTVESIDNLTSTPDRPIKSLKFQIAASPINHPKSIKCDSNEIQVQKPIDKEEIRIDSSKALQQGAGTNFGVMEKRNARIEAKKKFFAPFRKDIQQSCKDKSVRFILYNSLEKMNEKMYPSLRHKALPHSHKEDQYNYVSNYAENMKKSETKEPSQDMAIFTLIAGGDVRENISIQNDENPSSICQLDEDLDISGSSNHENNSVFEENEVFKKNPVISNEEIDSIKMKTIFVKKTESPEIDQQLVFSNIQKYETTLDKRSDILNDTSICKTDNNNQKRINKKNVSKTIGKKSIKMSPSNHQEYVPLGEKFSKLRKNTERSAKSLSIDTSALKFKEIRRSDRVSNGVSKNLKTEKDRSKEENHYSDFISAGLQEDTTECSKSQYKDEFKDKDKSKNDERPYLVDMTAKFQEEQKTKMKSRSETYSCNSSMGDANGYQTINSLLGRWLNSSSPAIMEEIIEKLIQICSQQSNLRILVQILYQNARDDIEKTSNVRFNDNPSMSSCHAQIVTLIIKFESKVPSDQLVNIDLVSQLIKFINNSLFGKAADNKPSMLSFKMGQLTNLTNILITLLRYKGDETSAKIFLYDVMFFKTPRSHVLISAFIDAWADIITNYRTNNSFDPLLETIVWLIYKTGEVKNLTDAKVHEARKKLSERCSFPNPKSSQVILYKKLITQAEAKFANKDVKMETMKALVLLAKHLSWTWCHNNVIKTLIERFQLWKQKCLESDEKGDFKSKPQMLLTWVVDCIGNVSRVYPAEGRERLREIFEPIKNILTEDKETNLLTADLEESCLRALIWTGHHLQVQVAEFLISWQPKHPQSPEAVELVKNFVGTRGEKYCQTTIKVWKKKSIYETLNAQVSQ